MSLDWIFKHPPTTLNEMALCPNIRDYLSLCQESGDYGHMIFYGSWGTGKTTAATILGKTHPNNFIEFDCTEHTTATAIKKIIKGSYAKSILGVKRIVLLDEFHTISKKDQTMFNKPMEQHYDLTTYLLCLNEIGDINPSIQGRSYTLDFNVGVLHPKTNKLKIHPHFNYTKTEWIDELKRCANLLADKEGVVISNETFKKVNSNDAYLISTRNYIRILNKQFLMDERHK